MTERERHAMLTFLDELMGPDVASTLVRHLPPGGWADVATKHDLDQLEDRLAHRFDTALTRQISDLRAELHAEITGVRTGLHSEIGNLRTEMGNLRTEMHGEIGSLHREIGSLHGEIGSLRTELHTEIGSLRTELHAEIGSVRSDMQAMTRTYILGNAGLVFTVAAIAFGAARLV